MERARLGGLRAKNAALVGGTTLGVGLLGALVGQPAKGLADFATGVLMVVAILMLGFSERKLRGGYLGYGMAFGALYAPSLAANAALAFSDWLWLAAVDPERADFLERQALLWIDGANLPAATETLLETAAVNYAVAYASVEFAGLALAAGLFYGVAALFLRRSPD